MQQAAELVSSDVELNQNEERTARSLRLCRYKSEPASGGDSSGHLNRVLVRMWTPFSLGFTKLIAWTPKADFGCLNLWAVDQGGRDRAVTVSPLGQHPLSRSMTLFLQGATEMTPSSGVFGGKLARNQFGQGASFRDVAMS